MNLTVFLFIPEKLCQNEPLVERLDWFIYKNISPNPLLVLKALAEKQLPVELIMEIRDRLADWAMIDTLISDYDLDCSTASQFVLDMREDFEKYVVFHQQLFTRDWSRPHTLTYMLMLLYALFNNACFVDGYYC